MRLLPIAALAPLVAALPATTPSPADIISQLTHLLQFIDVTITDQTLVDNQISLDFQVQNPLPLTLQVFSIQSTAGLNGTTLASFTHFFKDFVVPAGGTANSGTINNVTLTQGAADSLNFIPDGILDTTSTLSILAGGIIPIPIFPYNQKSVPTNYNIEG